MYRKIVWCYIIVLTLLDISLNTKLSAQGKSHGNGVSVHESLMEGISLQEWESSRGGGGDGGGGGGGGGRGAGAVSLSPASLEFGRRALSAAHTLSVTVTNTANETIHLASVAGTTPDFHASFFDAKTLACGANATFSVVYLGRREGPVHAHLYIHTSKGVHKYSVSAEGVASEWRVWPLVGLRLPENATLEPLLTLYNPTDTTVQISEVYSSGSWLGLELPGGEGAAPRSLWTLPPHRARSLVRLRLRAPPHAAAAGAAPLQAYIRIKGNMTGGGLVVGVEASAAPPGEFLSPLQLRLRTRGSRDPPDTFDVEAGNSAAAGLRLETQAWGACGGGAPPPPPHSSPPSTAHDKNTHNGDAVETGGAEATLLRTHLDPHQQLTRTATLTLDYAKMWAVYEAALANGSGQTNGWGSGAVSGAGVRGAVHCAGGLRVGGAALPYSLRLLPGTLALEPPQLHFVTCNTAESLRAQELIARNHFPEPISITHVHFPRQVKELFHTESLTPLELGAGASGAACRVRLRSRRTAPAPALRATITLHTNLTDYKLPLLLYEGIFSFEWDWPNSSDGTLRLGTVGAGRAVSVPARLHNRGPATLCLTRLAIHLPAPAVAAHFRRDEPACVEGGASLRVVLEVRAGSEAGAASGSARAHTRHGVASARVSLRVRPGELRAHPLLLPPAAPYVPSQAPLDLENSMPVRMRVLSVDQPRPAHPAILYLAEKGGEVTEGRGATGRVQFSPELVCEPHCYTGLLLDTPEGVAWSERGAEGAGGTGEEEREGAALEADAALQRARYALYTPAEHNFTLYLQTDEVARLGVPGSVRWKWPRVWSGEAGDAARAGLCGVGATLPLRLRAGNPSRSRSLLLQLRIADRPLLLGGDAEEEECAGCMWSASSFTEEGWRVTRGAAHARLHNGSQYLQLSPQAEVEFSITFAPADPADLAAYAYLRNNLTILERVLLTGRGAHPTFEIAGRKPNSSSPILFEVSECGSGAEAGAVRRAVAVRNTGRVALRLREWRVAGEPCAARGFRLQPCAALRLAPGETKELYLHFAADWTRSKAQATITVMVGGSVARFRVVGLTPARLVAACGKAAGRAPFERALRYAGASLCMVALLAAAALAAADAERALRRHRARRLQPDPPRAPLDLRALASAPAAAPSDPAPPAPASAPAPAAPAPAAGGAARTRRASRRRLAAPADPAAERRAFERWRAGVTRDAPPEDESRSEEEEEEAEAPAPAPLDAPAPPPRPPPPRGDASSSSPDSSPPPRDSYSSLRSRAAEGAAGMGDGEEEECVTSGEESSSLGEEREERAARGAGRRRPAPPLAPDAAPPALTHTTSRGTRARRESAEARRSERKSAEARHAEQSSNGTSGGGGSGSGARGGARSGTRKERSARRSAPPRTASPQAVPTRTAPPPPVRWGASWSDVVSRGNALQPDDDGRADGSAAPLAPIGSDVRRRLGSHSLFYYGGGPACWPPPAAAPAPPATPAAPAPPPVSDESSATGYRSLESLWGSSMEPMAPGAAWLWGTSAGAGAGAVTEAEGVRPPPGFPAPRPVRPYDPFQSLASIWTPAALDWRLDAGTPPPPSAAPLPADSAPPTPPPPLDDTAAI